MGTREQTSRRGGRFAHLLALAVVMTSPLCAATLPPGFQEQIVFSGLTEPTAVRFAADGRVFVAEKSGIIKVFDNLSDTTPTVFVDLRTQVHNFWDRCLLGMTLAPNFPSDPWVYVLYTRDAEIGGVAPRWGSVGGTSDGCSTPPGATDDGCVVSGRLSRVQASGNVAVGGEQVLIDDWCQQYPSHSIGNLAFGADGALYVSGGDGASFNVVDYGQDGSPRNPCGDPPGGVGGSMSPPSAEGGALRSQDVRTLGDLTGLSGTILRVDPATGAGLPDNPMGASSDPNARRIVGYGLRNPFRFAIRPGTNEVWVGDVGWNDWEEINRLVSPTAGSLKNFGWPCYEGDGRQGGYDAANLTLCESLYAAGSAAVVAPYFRYHHNELVVPNDVCPKGGSSVAGTSFAFATGSSYPAEYRNALFFADYTRRCIWVMPTGTLAVAFNGSASSDPDGDALTFAWDLDGDGAFNDAATATASFTYTQPGTYVARLRVTDPSGATGFASVTISAGNTPPTAFIDTPAAGTTWVVGDTIAFSGHATDAQSGTLPASGLTWSLILQHCPSTCHDHPLQTFTGVASGSFVAPDHEYPSQLELRLTATDPQGLSHTTSVRLDPRTVQLTFGSNPSGLSIAVGSTSQPTPFTRTAIIGSTLSVSAPSPQASGGTTYEFGSWSDGGAQTHNIVANTATSYVATYRVRVGGPVISQVISRPGPGRVTISWTTDVPADSQVQYGLTTAYGSSTPLDRTLVTSHSVTILNLSRRTDYFFQVSSRDSVGNLSSATGSFRTR